MRRCELGDWGLIIHKFADWMRRSRSPAARAAAPVIVALRRLSSYADAAMRSVLIRLCLVTVYVLVLLEVGMVLGAVT